MAPVPVHSLVVKHLTQRELNEICAKHDRLWSSKPGGARAVFAWMDLSGLDLAARNLCNADFTGAVLHDCKMTGARLDHATFFGADLAGANLTEASMRRADLRGASMRNCNLTGADLFEADLREGTMAAADRAFGYRLMEPRARPGEVQGATLCGANLERTRLSGIMAQRADFTDAILKDAKLIRANLKQAKLQGANLSGADLSGADLAGADLQDAVLVGVKTLAWNVMDANMKGVLTDEPRDGRPREGGLTYQIMVQEHARWCASGGAEGHPSNFEGADLRSLSTVRGFNLTALPAKGAVFYGLDMEGVQLQGAHLEGADLRNCNLRRADLRGARLAGAKLAGSDLREAQMGPLLINSDRVLPCDMTGANLKGADLAGADLRQAVLANADISRANFSGALLKQVNVVGATRTGARGLDEVI